MVCTRHLDIVGFMCHRACFLIEWVHFWAPWWEFGTDWDKLISLSELLEHEFYDKLSLDLCWSSHFSKNWHVCSKYFGQRKNGRLIELSPSAGDKKCLSVSLNMDVMLPFSLWPYSCQNLKKLSTNNTIYYHNHFCINDQDFLAK